jgi:rubrerythrin
MSTAASLIVRLRECRRAEKEQAHFYRALAALAEERGALELSERFQQLHADEQHQFSRLTARLLELGAGGAQADASPPTVDLESWESSARQREEAEVERYEHLLEEDLDEATRALIVQILEVERAHARELGGKWTMA